MPQVNEVSWTMIFFIFFILILFFFCLSSNKSFIFRVFPVLPTPKFILTL